MKEKPHPSPVKGVTMANLTKPHKKMQPSLKATLRLLSGQPSEMFTGRCFRCNKVRHQFCNKECEMYDPEFLNTSWGPAKTSKERQAPGMKGPSNTMGTKVTC